MSGSEQLIREHSTKILEKIDQRDERYLEKPCFRMGNKRLFEIYTKYGKYKIDNTSAAGVIQLKNSRLCFITKVHTQLLYMIRSLKSEKGFLFDQDTIIEVEGGDNFFDIIAFLFVNQLKNIIRMGLLPRYIKKCDNRDDLKGDFDIEGQIQNDIEDISKFSCIYHDLTTDNPENRIILRASNVLVSMIRFDKNLKKDLKTYKEYMIKNGVKLVEVSSEDCDRIHFDVSNDHYSLIIKLSKVILSENFIKSIHEGKSIGLNFIVDMNKVFQDFLTDITKDVIKSEFRKFIARDQKTFLSFIKGGSERPDMALKIRGIESYPILIEFKYMTKLRKGEFVQVGAYCISPIPGTRTCCIICPKPNDKDTIEKRNKIIRRSMMKDGKLEELPVYVYTIDLYMDGKSLGYEDFIKNVKDQIKNIISDIIQEIYI